MRRPTLAVVGVALLLSTAGCSGVLPGGETRTPYEVPPRPTPTATETPEERVGTGGAPADLVETLAVQESRLRETGGYTLQYSKRFGTGTLRNVTFRVDNGAGRGITRARYRPPGRPNRTRTVVYHDDGVFRGKRITEDGGIRFWNLSNPRNAPGLASARLFGSLARSTARAGLERNGTATFAGEEMARYTASGPGAAPPSVGDPEGYRATVLVDDDGLVRMIEVRKLDRSTGGDRYRWGWRMTLTGVDDTAVERPSWVTGRSAGTGDGAPGELAAALSDRVERLRSLDSYTLHVNRTVAAGNGVRSAGEFTFRVDRADGRGHQVVEIRRSPQPEPVRSVAYRGDGVLVLRRVAPDGDVTYRPLSSPEDTPANVSTEVLSAIGERLPGLDFERTGTATLAGEEVTRYTASGPDEAPDSAGYLAAYRATVLVDDDGLLRAVEIRTVEFSVEGDRTVTRIRATVTGVDDTSVERPAWVGNATTSEGDGEDSGRWEVRPT